jgi:hypothetical protein
MRYTIEMQFFRGSVADSELRPMLIKVCETLAKLKNTEIKLLSDDFTGEHVLYTNNPDPPDRQVRYPA